MRDRLPKRDRESDENDNCEDRINCLAATNIDGPNYEAIRDKRIELTKRILKELGCLPDQEANK